MYKILLILLLISLANSEQMYIHVRGNNEGVCTATMKQLTLSCTGNAGHSDFILGNARIGYANGRVIKNNTTGPIRTVLGWAYEMDKEIVEEWGDSIDSFIVNNPSQVVDIDWYNIPQIIIILPEATIE